MTAPANADNKALFGLGFLSRIARNKNFVRILAISLAAAAVASGAATYATLAGSKSFDDSPAIVLLLLNVDLVLSLLLAFLIARRIVAVWSERWKDRRFAPSSNLLSGLVWLLFRPLSGCFRFHSHFGVNLGLERSEQHSMNLERQPKFISRNTSVTFAPMLRRWRMT